MGSGDAPSTSELTQFLADGVLDVTEKWLMGHPEDRELFMDETDLQVAQGANIDGADIISVVRADGATAGNFRPCRKIPAALQSQVVDIESLSFASKYNPVYMLNSDNSVAVFPAPADNSGKDSYKIYYVNNTPLDGTGNALTETDSTLRSFPANKVYFVVLYASIQTLQAAMSNSIVSLSISIPVVPVLSDVSVSFSQSPPTFVPPSLSQVTTYIETNQDVELAGAKLQEVNANAQNALNTFNQQNAEYQAQLQISVENARQDGNEDAQKLQKYQGEVASYQAEVQKEVQEATTKAQQYQGLYMQLFQQYNTAFQIAQPQQQGGR